MHLNDMKYTDLQKLAKGLGIKANIKSDKLITAILEVQKAGADSVTSEKGLPKSDEQKSTKNVSKRKRRGPPARKGPMPFEGSLEESGTSVVSDVRARSSSRARFEKLTSPPVNAPNASMLVKKATPKVNVELPARVTPAVRRPTPTRQAKNPTPSVSKGVSSAKRISLPVKKAIGSRKTPPALKKTPLARKRTSLLKKPSIGRKSSASKSKRASVLAKVPSPPEKVGKSSAMSTEQIVTDNDTDGGRKRKRSDKLNSTYEIENETETAQTEEPKPKKSRDDVTDDVSTVISSLRPSMTNEEIKASIDASLTKSVHKKMEELTAVAKEKSNIPRFVTYLRNKEAASQQKNPVTPGNKNWGRIHKAEFDKMESIDDYLKKRIQRTNHLLNSGVKVDKVTDGTQSNTTSTTGGLRNTRASTTGGLRNNRASAAGGLRNNRASAAGGLRNNRASVALKNNAQKPTIPDRKKENEQQKFVPLITNVKDINTNFLSLTASKPKTPHVVRPLTALNASALKTARRSVASIADMSMAKTPAQVKPVFDLKASLAKPLTWKMYTGKLKPADGVKSMVGKQSHDKKDERRKDSQQRRADKKLDAQMKRRGIVA